MKKKAIVTNAMRMLDKAKVAFDVREYDGEGLLDGSDFGEKIAEITGIDPSTSFKTLVVRGDKNGINVVCIPVNMECDLKKTAGVTGNKKVEMIHVKELLGLTGYIRGGVSPIGMKKQYPTYIHNSCLEFEKVAVSAGICGATVILKPADLLRITGAKTADIAKFSSV